MKSSTQPSRPPASNIFRSPVPPGLSSSKRQRVDKLGFSSGTSCSSSSSTTETISRANSSLFVCIGRCQRPFGVLNDLKEHLKLHDEMGDHAVIRCRACSWQAQVRLRISLISGSVLLFPRSVGCTKCSVVRSVL